MTHWCHRDDLTVAYTKDDAEALRPLLFDDEASAWQVVARWTARNAIPAADVPPLVDDVVRAVPRLRRRGNRVYAMRTLALLGFHGHDVARAFACVWDTLRLGVPSHISWGSDVFAALEALSMTMSGVDESSDAWFEVVRDLPHYARRLVTSGRKRFGHALLLYVCRRSDEFCATLARQSFERVLLERLDAYSYDYNPALDEVFVHVMRHVDSVRDVYAYVCEYHPALCASGKMRRGSEALQEAVSHVLVHEEDPSPRRLRAAIADARTWCVGSQVSAHVARAEAYLAVILGHAQDDDKPTGGTSSNEGDGVRLRPHVPVCPITLQPFNELFR